MMHMATGLSLKQAGARAQALELGVISDVFFSSRRRHTRFDCDWSSDVCSSDLDDRRRHAAGALLAQARRRAHARLAALHSRRRGRRARAQLAAEPPDARAGVGLLSRSEEHTSELQSQSNIVCRLLLEKKKK